MSLSDFFVFLEEDLYKASDSVLRNIQLYLNKNKVVLELSAESLSYQDWINVEITLLGVEDYSIKSRSRNDLGVISSGISMIKHNDLYYIDFDSSAPWESATVEDHKKSALYFCFKDCLFTIKEYSECK